MKFSIFLSVYVLQLFVDGYDKLNEWKSSTSEHWMKNNFHTAVVLKLWAVNNLRKNMLEILDKNTALCYHDVSYSRHLLTDVLKYRRVDFFPLLKNLKVILDKTPEEQFRFAFSELTPQKYIKCIFDEVLEGTQVSAFNFEERDLVSSFRNVTEKDMEKIIQNLDNYLDIHINSSEELVDLLLTSKSFYIPQRILGLILLNTPIGVNILDEQIYIGYFLYYKKIQHKKWLKMLKKIKNQENKSLDIRTILNNTALILDNTDNLDIEETEGIEKSPKNIDELKLMFFKLAKHINFETFESSRKSKRSSEQNKQNSEKTRREDLEFDIKDDDLKMYKIPDMEVKKEEKNYDGQIFPRSIRNSREAVEYNTKNKSNDANLRHPSRSSVSRKTFTDKKVLSKILNDINQKLRRPAINDSQLGLDYEMDPIVPELLWLNSNLRYTDTDSKSLELVEPLKARKMLLSKDNIESTPPLQYNTKNKSNDANLRHPLSPNRGSISMKTFTDKKVLSKILNDINKKLKRLTVNDSQIGLDYETDQIVPELIWLNSNLRHNDNKSLELVQTRAEPEPLTARKMFLSEEKVKSTPLVQYNARKSSDANLRHSPSLNNRRVFRRTPTNKKVLSNILNDINKKLKRPPVNDDNKTGLVKPELFWLNTNHKKTANSSLESVQKKTERKPQQAKKMSQEKRQNKPQRHLIPEPDTKRQIKLKHPVTEQLLSRPVAPSIKGKQSTKKPSTDNRVKKSFLDRGKVKENKNKVIKKQDKFKNPVEEQPLPRQVTPSIKWKQSSDKSFRDRESVKKNKNHVTKTKKPSKVQSSISLQSKLTDKNGITNKLLEEEEKNKTDRDVSPKTNFNDNLVKILNGLLHLLEYQTKNGHDVMVGANSTDKNLKSTKDQIQAALNQLKSSDNLVNATDEVEKVSQMLDRLLESDDTPQKNRLLSLMETLVKHQNSTEEQTEEDLKDSSNEENYLSDLMLGTAVDYLDNVVQSFSEADMGALESDLLDDVL